MNSVDVKDQPLKISLKRYLLILGTALYCLLMPLSGLLLGAQHEVQVDFSFDVNAVPNKQIAGYRLYMEGQEICNTGPVDPQNITCMVSAEDGTYDFTLAARYDDNSLSPQSAAVPFTITTEATPPPVITLVGHNPQQLEVGAAYMELGATAADLVPGDLTDEVVIDASAVDTTTVGSYQVTYNVSDGAGNPAVEVLRTVTVQNTTPPVITLVGANPQQLEVGTAYMELGATATDLVQGDLTSAVVIDASAVDPNTVGSYGVTYNVMNGAGNAAVEVTRTVMVVIDEFSDVRILDAWVVDGSYANQDAIFNVSAGTDRIVLVGLSAEKNGNGPMSVTSVSLGDQELTEVFDFTVGSSGAYHNLHWLGYLLESEIAARSGSELTVTYANQPSNPFDEPKIHYASYEHVDQTTPIADSESNFSTNASSLQLNNALVAGDGDKIVGLNVLGQHYAPGLSTSGHTEETESIGATNGHTSAAYHRTATTSVTANPTFTSASATRMAVSALVLKAARIDDDTLVPVIASAAADSTSGVAPFSVILNGNGSSGSITGYSWDFGDGGTANGISATHIYQAAGTYTATLTVTAADGTTDNDNAVITVSEPLPPPVANISPQNTAGVAPFTVQFDGNNSTGTINSYSWEFGDGVGGSGQSALHTYETPGTYTATLTVAGAGSTSVDSVTIEVSAAPVSPIATISSSSAVGEAPLTVSFDGRGSSVTQTPMASYNWDFGDGTTATGPEVSHNYTIPGNFTATLTVTDNSGLDDSASTPVLINPPAEENQPPVSDFTLSSTTGSAPLSVSFNGSASQDPDGSIALYSWTLGDGTSYAGMSGQCEFAEVGEYTVTLEVTDNDGESAVSSQTVIVDQEEEVDLFIEISEIQIDGNWTFVSFDKSFNDPVVIVGPPSFEDRDPATVRVRNLTSNGFEIRIQEWDYLDDSHAYETVSFIVIDKGVYTLENGTKIEAGSFTGTSKFKGVSLQQTYNFKPVILEQVITEQDQDAVTGRIRNVNQSSFDFKLQEQETTKATHANETIGYIAWEPGTGSLGGLDYEVGSSGKYVKHTWYTLSFQNQVAEAPLFMANFQTQGGGDTAVVRTQQIDNTNVQIKVEEEQSRDSETRHVKEEVGYLAIIGSPN